ncbi:MAG TPA: hypothetical protein VF163_03670 [Micromonosporaceae bacterium]
MRHLLSVVLALILTPVIYMSSGYSAAKLSEANIGDLDFAAAGLGLLAGFLAGACYALLVMARLSPLGPFLGGLAYLGATVWALIDQAGFVDTVPADLFGVRGVLHIPVVTGTALLAVPLLLTIFSPRRWRRSAQPAPVAYQAAPEYPTTVSSAAPTYGDSPVYTPPTYQPPAATGLGTQGDEPRTQPLP